MTPGLLRISLKKVEGDGHTEHTEYGKVDVDQGQGKKSQGYGIQIFMILQDDTSLI